MGPSSPNVPVPTQVANALNFVSVAAGRHHTCAVTDAGGLYCWGSNALGQAGLGSAPGADVPTQVPGSSYVQVVAGENHTCALRVDQDAYCWGSNEWGQLGDGDDTFQAKTEPEPVASGPLKTLSAGRFHSCAITSGGVAYCWGLGTSGQLGGELPDDNEGRSNLPLPVGGALTFRLISAGGLHTCGVTIGNVAYCWGDNGFGALGDGTQSSSPVPVRVEFQP